VSDYRLSALERQIANRSTREYAKLGKGLSRGMRGLSARGLIGSSEQEQLLADIAEQKALVESESTAQRDMLRDQVKQEEEAKAGANLRNAFSIGGTLLGALGGLALAAPTGGLSIAAGMSGGAGLGSALGKIVGGGVTGTWDPTAANDIVTGLGAYSQKDPIDEIGKMLDVIEMHTATGSRLSVTPDLAASLIQMGRTGKRAAPPSGYTDYDMDEWYNKFYEGLSTADNLNTDENFAGFTSDLTKIGD
jgi:hypothetical protein